MMPLRRRTSWILVAGWLVLATAAGVLSGGLGDEVADEDTAFLPRGGPAVAFIEAERAAGRADDDHRATETAVVVVETGSALTPAVVDAVEELRAGLAAGVSGVPVAGVAEASRAVDGRAVAFEVELATDEEGLPEAVAGLRAEVGAALRGIEGARGHVTGSAAVDADLEAGDVDLKLLLGSMAVVVVILVLAYRSPVLWALPVATGVVAVVVARGLLWWLARSGVPVTELASSVVVVVVFGVSTDYSMLVLARIRGGAPTASVRTPILVSAGTIVAAVGALLLASLPGIRGLGASVAVGVVVAAAANLLLLPALLHVLPRRLLGWDTGADDGGRWRRIAAAVRRRAAAVAAGSGAVLAAAAAAGAFAWTTSSDPVANLEPGNDARQGIEAIRAHFGASAQAPVGVLLPVGFDDRDVLEARLRRIGAVVLPESDAVGDRVRLEVATGSAPYTEAWREEVDRIGAEVAAVAPDAVVGGDAVETIDREAAVRSDLVRVVPPLVVAIAVVLLLWLRRPGATLVLVGASCLSFAAAVGISVPLFGLVGGRTSSAEVLLFGFVFLFAFGVDYLVFLMDEVRRTRGEPGGPAAICGGLARTGPVITSAGLVLAATFGLLTFLPEVNVRQLGVLVAVGVLVDTLVVRTFLVPAVLLMLAGRRGRVAARASSSADRRARVGSF